MALLDVHEGAGITHADTPASLRGVALFISDNRLRVLTVRERTSKIATGRQRGEYGIPCETLESGESWGDAALRCIHKELGYPCEKIPEDFRADEGSFFMGEGNAGGVSGRGFKIHYVGPDIRAYARNMDGEVAVVGFLTLRKLRQKKLRFATELALGAYSPTGKIAGGGLLVPLTANLLDSVDRN